MAVAVVKPRVFVYERNHKENTSKQNHEASVSPPEDGTGPVLLVVQKIASKHLQDKKLYHDSCKTWRVDEHSHQQ